MWCKLRLKSFTASLGRMLHQSCFVSKCTVCLLKVATQRCFPLWKKKLFSCVMLNLYCYIRAARGRTTACWFWGKRGSAERTLLLHCFPSSWMTCGGMQFLTQGNSLRTRSSGLVCDRIRALLLIHQIDVICTHAHTNTLGNKNGGGEKEGVKQREILIWKKTTRFYTRKAQGTACIVAAVCRTHI